MNKRFRRRTYFKTTALILSCLLAYGSLLPTAQDPETVRLEGLFRTAKNDYQNKDYNGSIRSLDLLLSYFEDKVAGNRDRSRLKAQIYLLMGAAFERRGQEQEALQKYRLARDIFGELYEPIELRGVDLDGLVLYQEISGKKPVGAKQVIHRPKPRIKNKENRFPLLLIAATIVVGVAVYFLLIKKKSKKLDPHLDTNTLRIEYLMCPGGQFMMGDNFNEGDADEQPVHPVHLDQFKISKHEITFRQYDMFCDETNRLKPDDLGLGRENMPVFNVSYGDAVDFCGWLTIRTGKTIRLPTEAQWEYAARGTDQRRYPWGNSPPTCELVNHFCGDFQLHPVGSHPAGASYFQALDMAGNVAEWCMDHYNSTFYDSSPLSNPVFGPGIPGVGTTYVIRGGSFVGYTDIRSASRDHRPYGTNVYKSNDIGFRIVWVDL